MRHGVIASEPEENAQYFQKLEIVKRAVWYHDETVAGQISNPGKVIPFKQSTLTPQYTGVAMLAPHTEIVDLGCSGRYRSAVPQASLMRES